MHIVVGLLLLLGIGLYWYGRLKGPAQTGGAWPRRQNPSPADGAAIASIEDPLTGAAAMMAAIARAREPIDAATATVIKDELREAAGGDPTQAFENAVWALGSASDPDNVSLRLAHMWNGKLAPPERQQLLDMVTRVACMRGEPTSIQADAIGRLKARLDLS